MRTMTALTAAAAASIGLASCSAAGGGASSASAPGPAGSTSASGGAIAVSASDTACTLTRTTAPTGLVKFSVSNTGTKVTEFYVYAPGDRIVGEVENVGPGVSRDLSVELTEPGTYTTACKPGMTGDGIRAPFTVTGASATAAGSTDEKVARAIAAYQQFVATEAEEFLTKTTEFAGAVKAGDVAKAKSLYADARHPFEAIEPIASSFGDLDARIDGREDVVAEGKAFTGYHRLERDLWKDGLRPDSGAVADQLVADVTALVREARTVKLTGLQIANGAKALLDEVATGKITGEEERYSHTDLSDFDGNLEGSQSALDALRPVLAERDAALLAQLDSAFTELKAQLAKHKAGDGYRAYTDLSTDDVKALSVKLDVLSDRVATVAAVVARQ